MDTKNTAFYQDKQAINFDFSAEHVSSDGGVLLCEKIEREHRILADFSTHLPVKRSPYTTQYQLLDMLKQRIYLMMQGYEDCNDEQKLRNDPVISTVIGNDLCSQPTLSRFENSISKQTIFSLSYWFIERYVSSITEDRKQIIIDIDSTDDPTHGNQQLSMFSGFYSQTMYNELIINDGETGQVILPVLRPGNAHSNWWYVSVIKRIIKRIREKFPHLKIILRADSGFSTSKIYELADTLNFNFYIALAKNERLNKLTEEKENEIRKNYLEKGLKHKEIIGPFAYKADSWHKEQSIYAKVESTGKGMNLRYFTSDIEDAEPEELYTFYTLRGDRSENRIKEIKSMCYSDRLSCHRFWANSFRMMLSCLCYEFFRLIREKIKAKGFINAATWQVNNIRLHLLKIGSILKERVKYITLRFSKAFVHQDLLTELLRS
jgi:DNA-binding transcriptional MerR regulator